MEETRIQKTFIDYGLGFPVKLLNVPMIKVQGKWTPNIDYNVLGQAVLLNLCEKPAKLTGNEVRFIRQNFDMTLQLFAKRFAVSHAAIIKWENTGDNSTNMSWATEKDLRLFILDQLNFKPTQIVRLYKDLEELKPAQKRIIKVDLGEFAA